MFYLEPSPRSSEELLYNSTYMAQKNRPQHPPPTFDEDLIETNSLPKKLNICKAILKL
jgi:hypothetical protein